VPSIFKSGYITPLLKKADLDAADVKSYWPITNLSVVSKLLERLVAQQLTTYLTDNGLLPDLQSAYHARYHSTETAVLKVVGDILLALDSGNLALLSLLDLSAAFDTVDHDTLAASTVPDELRPRRCRHKMVCVILERPDAARTNTDHHVAVITCRVRSPSRIAPRTDPFSAVRRRPVEADQTSLAVHSRLRIRH